MAGDLPAILLWGSPTRLANGLSRLAPAGLGGSPGFRREAEHPVLALWLRHELAADARCRLSRAQHKLAIRARLASTARLVASSK